VNGFRHSGEFSGKELVAAKTNLSESARNVTGFPGERSVKRPPFIRPDRIGFGAIPFTLGFQLPNRARSATGECDSPLHPIDIQKANKFKILDVGAYRIRPW
jgi:hypothetical protein